MNSIDLRPDCGRCAALCCLALAFDKGPQFAEDKAAGQPCGHLGLSGCTIYDERKNRGYGGCVRYDCLGAGQRVTQDLHQGADWRENASFLDPMVRDFLAVQRAHTVLALVRQAQLLPVTPRERDRLAALEFALCKAGASPQLVSRQIERAYTFLRTLRQRATKTE